MLRAISLWQPWASAIAAGSKTYETRSWRFPKAYAGQFVAIHASRRWQREEREFAAEFKGHGIGLGYEGQPPLGALVAVGRLVECLPTEALYGPDAANPAIPDRRAWEEYMLGNHGPGRFAWKFADVVRLDPIPCIGRQGFWALEQEVERAVRSQTIIDVCAFSGLVCHPGCDPFMCRRAARP